MREQPEGDRREEAQGQQWQASSDLEGFVELGMKREALRLARRNLKCSQIEANKFNDALKAILTLADTLKPWAQLVDSAYERLRKSDWLATRFWIMSFRACCQDHKGVLRLVPQRLVGTYDPAELVFAVEAAFALDNKELARKLAKRLPKAIEDTDDPIKHAQLLLCLSEFYAREGRWDNAIVIAEAAQSCETFNRDAVVCIIDIHVARALRVLQHGFKLIEQFNQNFDPGTETTLPGNDKAVQADAAKNFMRLRRILEKIVPRKRQVELGLRPAL